MKAASIRTIVSAFIAFVCLPGLSERHVGADDTQAVATKGLSLLAVGNSSNNVVQYDLSTGQPTVIARLANGSKPRSIAVNQQGEIFLALRGNRKNVVKLVPARPDDPHSPLIAVDVTPTIGRYGPGQIAFDRFGLLNVAGGTRRAVLRYNVETGDLVESATVNGCCNVVGLTIDGDDCYVAEYFQRNVLHFDLSADPTSGRRFVSRSEHLDRPHGMAVGPGGNLFVSNLLTNQVQEFSGQDGTFVRTFIDTRSIGGGHVDDLLFDPRLQQFFLTSRNVIYQLSNRGELLGRYEDESLAGVQGVAVIPVQTPAASSLTAIDSALGY